VETGARTVEELRLRFADLWWACDGSEPPELPAYTRAEQLEREASLSQFLEAFSTEAAAPPRTAEAHQAAQERMLLSVDRFLRPALDLDKRHIDVLVSNHLTDRAAEFAQMARRFDPSIGNEEVFQASRNAWTMHCLQILLGQEVQVTPAVLGYSLIYPYDDNTLDDPAVPEAAKAAFNERLARRLAGEPVPEPSDHERPVWNLLRMIEDQYARGYYPQVYEGLMAIHRAQVRSLRLLRRGASPYEVDVLGISLEKGGASVLVDGILVAGRLNPAQAEALFGYGAFLQLGDDLQDVAQDRKEELWTIFSQTARHWPLDRLTEQLLVFRQPVLRLMECFDAPGSLPLRELAECATTHLVLQAAGRAQQFYTRRTVQELETHSPFRFSFLQRTRRKLARKGLSLAGLLPALATTDLAGLREPLGPPSEGL
jgi:hypothetical protein